MSGGAGPRKTRIPRSPRTTQQLKLHLMAQMIIKRFVESFDSAIRSDKEKQINSAAA